MKLILIIGTRSEYIQIEPIYKEAKKSGLDVVLINTGQHYDYEMSRVFLKDLELPEPDYHLGIGSGTHGEQIGKMLVALEKVLMKEKPDITLVSGDTNSALSGGLISSRLHIPVAHNEAGMRSYNRNMPDTVKAGVNVLMNSDINKIVEAENNFTPRYDLYHTNIFGNGDAAEKIIDTIQRVI